MSDGKLRGKMKHTKQKSWWRFWRKARFDPEKFEEDLQASSTTTTKKASTMPGSLTTRSIWPRTRRIRS
nr:hypothetical protein [Rhodothermus marinus]